MTSNIKGLFADYVHSTDSCQLIKDDDALFDMYTILVFRDARCYKCKAASNRHIPGDPCLLLLVIFSHSTRLPVN